MMPHPLQMPLHRLLPQRELLQQKAPSSFLLQTQHAPQMVPPPPALPLLLSLPLPSLQKGVQCRNRHRPNLLSGSREKPCGWMGQTGSVDREPSTGNNEANCWSSFCRSGHNSGVQLVLRAYLVKFEFLRDFSISTTVRVLPHNRPPSPPTLAFLRTDVHTYRHARAAICRHGGNTKRQQAWSWS